jgi:hypothetical protein
MGLGECIVRVPVGFTGGVLYGDTLFCSSDSPGEVSYGSVGVFAPSNRTDDLAPAAGPESVVERRDVIGITLRHVTPLAAVCLGPSSSEYHYKVLTPSWEQICNRFDNAAIPDG